MKFKEIIFQPLIVIGDLLKETFSDCCVRYPCHNIESDILDLNMDYRSSEKGTHIYLMGEIYLVDLCFMITYDRFLYMEKYDTFIIIEICEGNNINMYIDYLDSDFGHDFNNFQGRRGISDADGVDEEFGKTRKRLCFKNMSISELDNQTLVLELHEFVKTKIYNEDEYERYVKKIKEIVKDKS